MSKLKIYIYIYIYIDVLLIEYLFIMNARKPPPPLIDGVLHQVLLFFPFKYNNNRYTLRPNRYSDQALNLLRLNFSQSAKFSNVFFSSFLSFSFCWAFEVTSDFHPSGPLPHLWALLGGKKSNNGIIRNVGDV